MRQRLLIVGNPASYHIGAHFQHAAQALDLEVELCDTTAAFAAPWPVVQFNWRRRGHRPPRLQAFSRHVLETCRIFRPDWILATGSAPLTKACLAEIGQLGIRRCNYLTDDPWNPAHRAEWFLQALPHYDAVFSPRQANMADLHRAGCQQVQYLPFAYAPEIHFPEMPEVAEAERYASDVLFFGGADPDRLPYIQALIQGGFKLRLYGGYWDRHAVTRPYACGHADPATLRKAVSAARVTLCLVRRANRDGHVMRTFEGPAMGACLLVEDTPEQRVILGEDGEAVRYFSDMPDLVRQVQWLLLRPEEGARLRQAAYGRITGTANTYRDRLQVMLA